MTWWCAGMPCPSGLCHDTWHFPLLGCLPCAKGRLQGSPRHVAAFLPTADLGLLFSLIPGSSEAVEELEMDGQRDRSIPYSFSTIYWLPLPLASALLPLPLLLCLLSYSFWLFWDESLAFKATTRPVWALNLAVVIWQHIVSCRGQKGFWWGLHSCRTQRRRFACLISLAVFGPGTFLWLRLPRDTWLLNKHSSIFWALLPDRPREDLLSDSNINKWGACLTLSCI